MRAYQACQRQYARMLAEFDLTVAQFDLLAAIHDGAGTATPASAAERLMVTRGNVSPLLHRLVVRGWVHERPNAADRRSVLLSLTARGAKAFARAREGSACFIAEQLRPFDDPEVASTLAQMEAMRAHLERMDIDAVLSRARAMRPSSSPAARRRRP